MTLMTPEKKQQLKKEKDDLHKEEIGKIENAIRLLKERYKNELAALENRLEVENIHKDLWQSFK